MSFVKHKGMNKELTVGKVTKWIGVFAAVLGIAFYCGAFLAFVQGVATQIGVLAIFGTLCLALGIVLFIAGFRKIKKSK